MPARRKSTATSPSRVRAAAKATARSPRPRSCSSAEAIKRSGGPGELGRRKACFSLVLDAEGVDPRASRLSDGEVRRDRVEHAGETHRLSGLDAERDDVLYLEVDGISDAHTVTNSVIANVESCPLDAEHLSDERREAGHWPTELTGEHLYELVRLFICRVLVDEHPQPPVPSVMILGVSAIAAILSPPISVPSISPSRML